MNKAFISCRVNAALDDRSGAREQNSSSAPQERQKERERDRGGREERKRETTSALLPVHTGEIKNVGTLLMEGFVRASLKSFCPRPAPPWGRIWPRWCDWV